MEPSATKPSLIIDPDTAFLSRISNDSKSFTAGSVVAGSEAVVEAAFKFGITNYAGVFLNPAISEPGGVPLVKRIRTESPCTPIFLLAEASQPAWPAEHLRSLTIAGCLTKPLTFSDMQEALRNREPVIAPAPDGTAEVEGGDGDFLPILARNFLSGNESFFDVFIRINARKYLQVLKAGEGFPASRLEAYLKKGATHLYLRKSAQENYVSHCYSIAAALSGREQADTDLRLSQVANFGEETAKFLSACGVNDDTLYFARQFAKTAHTLVGSLGLKRNECVRRHVENNLHLEHSVSVAMIASILATKLDIRSDKGALGVGLAAMLHDVGLERLDERIRHVDPLLLSPGELAAHQLHPRIGAEMLRSLGGIDPVVIQAVAQHHERRTGKGFPGQLGAGQINIVAELIGISEEFVTHLGALKLNPGQRMQAKMDRICSDGFSPAVTAAFRELFPPKQ